jgi:hypothetical protein
MYHTSTGAGETKVDIDVGIKTAIYVVGVWGGAIVPIAFAIYYTLIANWWETPSGRTIVGLDLCIWLLRVDRITDFYRYPGHAHLRQADWIVAIVNLAIPCIIGYRLVAFEAKRQRMKRQARETAEKLKLLLTGLVP